MGIGSSETGQSALLPLPSKSLATRKIENYNLPPELVQDKSALKNNDHGMDVLKVTKVRHFSCGRTRFRLNI